MNMLRDPIWEGIAAVLTILTVVLAVVAFISPGFRESLRGHLIGIANNRLTRTGTVVAVIFGVGVIVGILVTPKGSSSDTLGLPLPSQIAEAAWQALEEKEYLLAYKLADVCIATFEQQAIQVQRALSISGEPLYPTGRIEDNDITTEIFSHGVLNEVGACHIIKGDALTSLDCIGEARAVYSETQQFAHARVWDPSQAGFWSVVDVASQKLVNLPDTDETPDVRCAVEEIQ